MAWRISKTQAAIGSNVAWRVTLANATVTPTQSTNRAWRITKTQVTVNAVASVSAGTDQTQIEPWTTVSLRGTTTPTGFWTQTAGTPVTLQTVNERATYTAPAALNRTTLQFTYTAAGINDSVTHTILPATEKTATGGNWQPCQIKPLKTL